jgi:hypothetical protein
MPSVWEEAGGAEVSAQTSPRRTMACRCALRAAEAERSPTPESDAGAGRP